MSKYTRQINVKVSPEMARDLMYAAEYEGVKPSELIRGWIRSALNVLNHDKRYVAWRTSAISARKTGEEEFGEVQRTEEGE